MEGQRHHHYWNILTQVWSHAGRHTDSTCYSLKTWTLRRRHISRLPCCYFPCTIVQVSRRCLRDMCWGHNSSYKSIRESSVTSDNVYFSAWDKPIIIKDDGKEDVMACPICRQELWFCHSAQTLLNSTSFTMKCFRARELKWGLLRNSVNMVPRLNHSSSAARQLWVITNHHEMSWPMMNFLETVQRLIQWNTKQLESIFSGGKLFPFKQFKCTFFHQILYTLHSIKFMVTCRQTLFCKVLSSWIFCCLITQIIFTNKCMCFVN